MNRYIVETRDHSPTLFVPELDEHYHSIHGALQESRHVFIQSGLRALPQTKNIRILEVGFGTGLNAVLTMLEAEEKQQKIEYTALEKYPLSMDEVVLLNYQDVLQDTTISEQFGKLHQSPWEEKSSISPYFELTKEKTDLKLFSAEPRFNLIYFDAFAPSAQPELWTVDIFKRMHQALEKGGILVTYCVKGEVRRNMRAAGFEVEKIPGPPGKREMARCIKL